MSEKNEKNLGEETKKVDKEPENKQESSVEEKLKETEDK